MDAGLLPRHGEERGPSAELWSCGFRIALACCTRVGREGPWYLLPTPLLLPHTCCLSPQGNVSTCPAEPKSKQSWPIGERFSVHRAGDDLSSCCPNRLCAHEQLSQAHDKPQISKAQCGTHMPYIRIKLTAL